MSQIGFSIHLNDTYRTKYFLTSKMGKGTDASDTNAKMTLGCSALTFIMGMLHSDYYALKEAG